MRRDAAIGLAQDVLVWLASDPDAFGRFLALTGIDADGLRARTSDPVLLAAVLDHLLGSDADVRAFAEAEGIDPHLPTAARAALPGGDAPFWT